MFIFLIKKSFWDFWDNMGRIMIANLLFTALAMGVVGTTYVARLSFPLAIVLLVLIVLLSFLLQGGVSLYIRKINDFRPDDFNTIFSSIRENWKASLTGGVVISAILILTFLALRFYILLGGILGIMGAVFIFWILITVALSSLYYFPVINRLKSTQLKMFKKCFLIFIDNPFATVGVFLGLLLNMALSFMTVGLLPGPAGALLWFDNAIKLLVYKYDYLEENPDARGKKIPWAALFLDDKDKIGPRTFRNTIFPWK